MFTVRRTDDRDIPRPTFTSEPCTAAVQHIKTSHGRMTDTGNSRTSATEAVRYERNRPEKRLITVSSLYKMVHHRHCDPGFQAAVAAAAAAAAAVVGLVVVV